LISIPAEVPRRSALRETAPFERRSDAPSSESYD